MSKALAYYVGLDLGQSADYSALAIIEEPMWGGRWVSPDSLSPEDFAAHAKRVRDHGRPPHPPLSVRHLERFPLRTSYPKVIERVQKLLNTPPLSDKPTVLLVDKTGVGASVVDSFWQAGVNPIAITIHGGSDVNPDPHMPGHRVPKRDLAGAVQVLLQTGRLKVARSLPEADTLREELLNFRVKIDPKTAHDSYEHWREGDHDDLVLATAMACWFREWYWGVVDAHYAAKEVNERAVS